MGLRDMIRAIREYPAVHAELETAHTELRQAQQSLEQSEQAYKFLKIENEEQTHYEDFLTQQTSALRNVLQEFCPKLSSVDDMKRFYDTIAPNVDRKGFTLYHTAERLTGVDVPSFFPYEDNRGLFEEMDGHQLLRWLTAAHFHAVDWTVVPGTCCESATLREVDTTTPEYQSFERQLYEKVLERMGFQDILTPDHPKEKSETARVVLAAPQRSDRGGDAR